MNGFNWVKALGFGVVIWAVMFALVWLTMTMAMFANVWAQLVLAIAAGVVAYLFSLNVKSSDFGPALGYGAVFAAVGIILDLIFSHQLVSGLLGLWTYYLAYALILFAPSVEVGLRGSMSAGVTR